MHSFGNLLHIIKTLCMTKLLIIQFTKEAQDAVLQPLLNKCLFLNVVDITKFKTSHYTTSLYFFLRLKEMILKEKDIKMRLQTDVQQLKDETERLTNELNQAKNKEAEHQKAMQALEEALSKMETQRLQQRAIEVNIFHN